MHEREPMRKVVIRHIFISSRNVGDNIGKVAAINSLIILFDDHLRHIDELICGVRKNWKINVLVFGNWALIIVGYSNELKHGGKDIGIKAHAFSEKLFEV